MHRLPTQRLWWVSVIAALTLLLLLFGCSDASLSSLPWFSTTPSPTATAPPPTNTPVPSPTPLPRGGSLTVRLAQAIPILQPWHPRSRGEEQVISLLYSGLMQLDENLFPQPDLAEMWEASADGRTLTFTLRTDVTWHDGEPFSAVDVHFTLDRMHALPYTSTALLSDVQTYIAAVETPDSHTVVLSLTERYAPILSELTLPILPYHLLAERELRSLNFWDVPIGTGPFRFEQRQRGKSIVLTRYDDFYRGQPLLDHVAFVGSSDVQVTLRALKDEQLLLAELPWNTMHTITETSEQLHVGGYPENGFYFLAFNLQEGRPFADVRVRQALAKAVDISHLIQTMTKGQGIPIANSASPGSWADLFPAQPDDPEASRQPASGIYQNEPDLDEARALLEEAEWTLPEGTTIRQQNGVPFSATLYVRGDDVRRVATAKRIAEIGASIGLQIQVEPADFATTILSKISPPYDFDLLLGSWSNGAGDPNFADYIYYDPDDFALFHSSQINRGGTDTRMTRNFVGFSDFVYDTQAQRGRQLYHKHERQEAYEKTQARVAQLLPYFYLWTDRISVLLNTQVTTLDGPVNLSTPTYFWNIERWYLSNNLSP